MYNYVDYLSFVSIKLENSLLLAISCSNWKELTRTNSCDRQAKKRMYC